MSTAALKSTILDMQVCETRDPLLYLCMVLEEQEIPDVDPLALQAKAIAERVNAMLTRLNAGEFDVNELPDFVSKLKDDYQSLYHLSHVGDYSKVVKQAVLQLCGCIAGILMMLPMGLMSMIHCFIFLDQHNFATFKELPGYFVTGLLIGVCICARFFESFENRQDRQMRSSLNGLFHSFSSLESHLRENDFLGNTKEALLTDLFGEDEVAKTAFREGTHPYQLIGFQAEFFSTNLKGNVGHHSTLVFSIQEHRYIIETGSDSSKEINEALRQRAELPEAERVDQIFDRECTGEALLNMYAMHQLLQKRYAIELKNAPHFISVYKPGDHDCHTYVDKVLASVGEPMSDVKRYYKNDSRVGIAMCSLLEKYGTFEHKPVYPETTNSASYPGNEIQASTFDINVNGVHAPAH